MNALCNRGSFEIFNPIEDCAWDESIACHPEGSFFHTAAWAKVLCDTYGFRPAYFVSREKDRIVSLVPLIEVNSWLTGKRGVSLPFTDCCEPIGCNGSDAEIFQMLVARGKEQGWKYLECRWGKRLGDAAGSNSFYSHLLKLNKSAEALFSGFSDATRRAIKKTEKSNLKLEVCDTLEAMQAFYALHCKTRKKHGLPPQPFRFFSNVHRHVLSKKLGVIILAKMQQAVVAAGIYFHIRKRAIFKFGASDFKYQELRANNAVMWKAIQWYSRNGCETLDFGRTSLANEGLRKFKLGWGPEERELSYFRYDLNKETFLKGKDDAFGWYNHVFQHLPIPSLRLAGAMIYKHIA